MKTAFSYWDHRIAPVFDTAPCLHIVESASGKITAETFVNLHNDMPPQTVAMRLMELGVNTLVCGAISRPIYEIIAAYEIQIVSFVAGELPEVITAWLTGAIKSDAFAMPGCRGRWQQGGGRCGFGEERCRQAAGSLGMRRQRINNRAGESLLCICPNCGRCEAHQRGIPCAKRQCPSCGATMVRQQPSITKRR